MCPLRGTAWGRPLPEAAHASAHSAGWGPLSSPCLTNQNRGTETVPGWPKVTPGGNDGLGFGPRPPVLAAWPERNSCPSGRGDTQMMDSLAMPGVCVKDRLLPWRVSCQHSLS